MSEIKFIKLNILAYTNFPPRSRESAKSTTLRLILHYEYRTSCSCWVPGTHQPVWLCIYVCCVFFSEEARSLNYSNTKTPPPTSWELWVVLSLIRSSRIIATTCPVPHDACCPPGSSDEHTNRNYFYFNLETPGQRDDLGPAPQRPNNHVIHRST